MSSATLTIPEKTLFKRLFSQTSLGFASFSAFFNASSGQCDFRLSECNEAFEKLTCIKKDILQNYSIGQCPSGSFLKQELVCSTFHKVFREGVKSELELPTPQNRWVKVEVIKIEEDHLIALLTDITMQKKSELALHERTEDLSRKILMMSLLVYLSKLSHDRNVNIPEILEKTAKLLPSIWRNPDATGSRIIYGEQSYHSQGFRENPWREQCELQVFGTVCGSIEIHTQNETDQLSSEESFEILVTLTGVLGSIIESLENRQSLFESETKYRQYVDNAPDGIFVANEKGDYLEVNRSACDMLGYSREELLSKSIFDIIPPENMRQEKSIFQELKSKGRQKGRTVLRRKDSSLIPIAISAVRLPDGHLMAFCRDITERKKTEMEKELYFSAIQSLSQPLVITDVNGNILEVNESFLNMYGYSKEEVIGKNPSVLNPGLNVYKELGYSEEDYHQLFKQLWKSIRDPKTGTWENMIVNRKKDGSLLWVRLLINGVFNENGSLQNFIGLPIDISGIRKKENLSKAQLYHTIASLAELRDNETGNHMRRVGIFAKKIAESLGQPEKYCDDIEIFAPMHDIGKVGILDSILLAERKLTSDEFEEMKKHTILGHNIVKGNSELEMVAAITLHHHERFDGKGYPKGLIGEAIPLSARITAIADVYDALRSKRPYKEEWPHEKAVEEIKRNAGTQFDPELVEKFLSLEKDFENAYQALRD